MELLLADNGVGSLFSDLPTKNGYNYLNMYVRKDNYLTYDGESYKRIDDENKSITWNDGSKSLYGQRITLFDCLEPYIFFGMWGVLLVYVLFIEWKIKRNLKRKNRLNEASKTLSRLSLLTHDRKESSAYCVAADEPNRWEYL